jgi:hypothetical protein
MSHTRRPPSQRLIRNYAGLFFKNGAWTAYVSEANLFPTVTQALEIRNRFGLDHIQLIAWPEQTFSFGLLTN